MERVVINSIEPFESPELEQGFKESIREHGQKVAVILAKLPEPEKVAECPNPVEYRVVCGRRRIKALTEIGTPTVLAEVIEANQVEEAGLVIIENMQRSHNPASEAQAFSFFIHMGKTETEISQMFGVSKSKVSTRLKLLSLNRPLFAKLESGELSARAAWVAADLDPEIQEKLAEQQEMVSIAKVEALRKKQNLATLDLPSLSIPSFHEQVKSKKESSAAETSAPAMSLPAVPVVNDNLVGKCRRVIDLLSEIRSDLDGPQRKAVNKAAEVLESILVQLELEPMTEIMEEIENDFADAAPKTRAPRRSRRQSRVAGLVAA